jgi:hypothetical protein
VLQATLVDTWASTAAGAFALSENNLYTTDALRDYLLHLTDDGLIAFTRWGFDPPRESLRLLSLAIEALGQLGEASPAQHVIVGRAGPTEGWGALDTVLIARKPFREGRHRAGARVIQAASMEVSICRASRSTTSLRSAPRAESGTVSARVYVRHQSRERQPAVLLLYGAAARFVEILSTASTHQRGLQDQ